MFKEKLTSQPQVESAVNKGLLPKDSLKTIDKGQSVNLYKKVMPNPNDFVGFFDQPLITSEGKRSGLKGTRKDGLAKHLSKALIFDALMEVRQEDAVNKLLTEEFNVELDIVDLAAKISREVDVKFSKSNAVTDMNNAIDSGINTGVYSEIRFSKSHREQYEKQLNKRRPDLTEDQRKNAVQSVFDFVDGRDIPNHKKSKYEKLAMHYTANGFLILPEDGYKVIEAERIATIKKLDPFSYKNPNVLIEDNVVKKKVKRTDPDTIGTFSNKTEYGNGVVVYNVEDSKKGQKDVREVIDTHFGKNSNPWCLVARQKEGIMDIPDTEVFDNREEAEAMKMVFEETGRYETVNVVSFTYYDDGITVPQWIVEANEPAKKLDPNYDELESAWVYWKKYNENTEGLGFRIAFHNGELVAFRDGKKSPRWWDRTDKPFDAPVIRGKKGEDGFKPVSLAYKNNTVELYHERQIGDNKNGAYTKKDIDGVIILQKNKKDGELHGEQFQRRDDKSTHYIEERFEVYDNGKRTRDLVKNVYRDYKGKSVSRENIYFGRDYLTLDNITKYERIIEEGSPVQTKFGAVGAGFKSKSGFITTTIEGTISQRNERYNNRQGEKVTVIETRKMIISTAEDLVVTINGEVQETRVKFSETRKHNSQLQLTELQRKNKTLPALQGKIQEIEKRIREGKGTDVDNLIQSTDVLSVMQDLFSLKLSAEEVYNVLTSEFNDVNIEGFETIDSFIQHIKDTQVPKIRSIGFEVSKKRLEKEIEGLDDKNKIIVINKYLKNIGRSTRSGMINGLTTNRLFLNNVLKPILRNKFVEENYKLVKIPTGEMIVFKSKEGKIIIDKVSYEAVPMYHNIEDIKNNARSNPDIARIVNEEAKEATGFVMEIINDESLSVAEKLTMIDLMSLDQRGAIRKMAKMGITLTSQSGFTSKDLVLEHEYPIAELVDLLKKHIKEGPKVQAELDGVIDRMRVHVLPKEIDTLLNAAGLKSKGGFIRYTYDEAIVNFFADNYANNIIEALPESSYAAFDNQKLIEVIEQASKSKKPKGISILDFDDTLATSSSLIRFTRPDGTKGTLTPEQYASTYEDLSGMKYDFDFSEFNKVVDGKPAPLLNKAKKLAEKFGTDDMFILTARPAESAPAIQKFLKENGLNIPLKNITGLGNSTADAKALWVLDKANEGFNDFYFADDAIQNVQAVQNMLDQIDVKSKVQQARVDFSKSKIDTYFNNILEDISGINANQTISEKLGEARGKSKGKFRYFIPPSHEDFVGLLYNLSLIHI